MQKNPHLLIEGMIIAAWAAGINRSFIYIRGEYEHQADILEAALAEAREAGYLGERILRLRPHARHGRPPRRRRLHLRRGDRAARLARGQARQPAPEAAVPRAPGPLPGADADQQRRDADERPASSCGWAARSTRRSAPRPRPARRSSPSRAACSRPGNYEIDARHALARASSTDLAGGPARGPQGQGLVPRRLERAGAARHRREPRPALRLRLAGQGRLDARLGRDHRHRRLDPDRRRRAARRRSSTATSRAASARRAARARTGP